MALTGPTRLSTHRISAYLACSLLAAWWPLPAIAQPAGDSSVPATPNPPANPSQPVTPNPPANPDVAGNPSDPATTETAAEAELSPEEMAEIAAALGADAAEMAESRPQPVGPSSAVAALQSMNPDIALIADFALAYFSDGDNLQTGGHDPTKTGFNLQQLEMTLGKAVDPYFRMDANLVFSQFGVEIEEVYATTLALPYNLQARVGQFLTQVGRINPTHPHSWDFVDQPIAIGRLFGSEGNRGLGMELSYLTPLPWYVEITGSVTDAAGEATARSFFGPTPLPVESPLDFQTSLMIKQFFPLGDDWSLLWGLSAITGPNGSGHDNRSDIYGTDIYLKYRPISRASDTVVTLQSEWFYRRRQVPRDVLADMSGYVQGFWRFHKRWGTAVRYELGTPAKNQAGLATGDTLDPEWTENRHRASANITFWPTEFSRIRGQAGMDLPGWREQPIYSLFLAFEFNIGAHGAHKF